MPDIKGLPYPNASAIPDGPGAFLTLNSVLASGRVFRRFATWTAMDAVGDAVTNELAIGDAGPGVWFKFDGADWVMNGTARFADATARDAALPSPAAGMLALTTDTGITYRYSGSAWVLLNPYLELVNTSSIANATVTVLGSTATPTVPWTEVADANGWHNPSTNPTRITPTIAGRYQIILQGGFASNVTGIRYYALKFNGAAYATNDRIIIDAATDPTAGGQVTTERTFNGTTDYVEAEIYQTSGGALVPNVKLIVRYMGPA